jgi:hypothetical protein
VEKTSVSDRVRNEEVLLGGNVERSVILKMNKKAI